LFGSLDSPFDQTAPFMQYAHDRFEEKMGHEDVENHDIEDRNEERIVQLNHRLILTVGPGMRTGKDARTNTVTKLGK
jgi:hypothetical protein